MDIPNPDVNVTETRKWLRLKYENLATPAEKVILNNLEVLAAQNTTIIQGQEALGSLLQRFMPIRSARSTAKSSASKRGPEEDAVDLEETPAAKAVKMLKEEYFEEIFDIYTNFIKATKKKPYVTRVAGATADANSFRAQIVSVVSEQDPPHPMLDLITTLNDDLMVDLYAALGKKKKAAEGNKAGKGKGREQSTGAGSKRAASPDAPQSSQSQLSDRELRLQQRRHKRTRFEKDVQSSTDSDHDDTIR